MKQAYTMGACIGTDAGRAGWLLQMAIGCFGFVEPSGNTTTWCMENARPYMKVFADLTYKVDNLRTLKMPAAEATNIRDTAYQPLYILSGANGL